MPSRFTTLNFDAPFVLQDGRSRSLHFTAGELQSRMRLEAPDALEVDYTRTMMGFLLLNNQPHHIAMIGMGGGSLLCSPAFYRDCQRALAPEGVMVVNLHADHPAHIQHLQHICHAFQGNVMQAMASEKCNVIVFARRGAEVSLQALRNADWSASLCTPATATLRGEFARIGWVATGTKPFSAALP
jgi:spermidine synthase